MKKTQLLNLKKRSRMKKIVLFMLEILGVVLTHLGKKQAESKRKDTGDAQD
jgi:hypothetical protein